MTTHNKKLITIVSPVYNNSEALPELKQKIEETFLNKLNNYNFEIIFVNDGSSDNSLEVLFELAEKDKRVKIINFSRNFGQVAALIAGFRHAKGEAAICISADLQDSPDNFISMIEAWDVKRKKIVICYREEREDSLYARFFSGIFYFLMKQLYKNMPKGGFDFVLLDKKPLSVFNMSKTRHRFFQGDILTLGFSIEYIPYTREARKYGKSQWSLKKKVKYFLDGIVTSTYLPLRLMSIVGGITAFLGFLYSLVILYLRIINQLPFQGYAVIVILILLIGGCTMLMLGIIGEYLWRIYDEVQQKPLYVISDIVDKDSE
jgi:dolichol-phosphate mannosyltransferase